MIGRKFIVVIAAMVALAGGAVVGLYLYTPGPSPPPTEPGGQVSVQRGGTKVAEAVADEQGEWSVVLEKPLPTGDHALSLKITSPDGTRALTSQESVRVAVGTDEKKGTPPAAAMEAAKTSLPQAAAARTDASTVPPPAQPRAARAGETQQPSS